MEIRSLKGASFTTITLLIVVNFLTVGVAQNCGVPKFVNVKQSDQLRETMDTGQLLTTIPVVNVKNVIECSQRFKVDFDLDASQIKIYLVEPLWTPGGTSYIDETRYCNVAVNISLECNDGLVKDVVVKIPIVDENTQAPAFETNYYEMDTEPCIADRCAMIFVNDIVVIDKDRDRENAEVYISSDLEGIELIWNIMSVDGWYENITTYPAKQTQRGFQTKVRLSISPTKQTVPQSSIQFQLTATNTVGHVSGSPTLATTNVTIHFKEWPGRPLPPVFSSPFYYSTVEEFRGKLDIKPKPIAAYVPLNISDGSIITYKMDGKPDILEVDAKGVRFRRDVLNDSLIETLKNTEASFDVVAVRKKKMWGVSNSTEVATSRAVLTVFFPKDLECDECSSTTPSPGTCPTPACPEPDPCPTTPPAWIITLPIEPSIPTTGMTITSTTITPEPPTTTERLTYPTTITTDLPTTDAGTTVPTESPTEEPTTTEEPSTTPPDDGDCDCNCDNFQCQLPTTPSYSSYDDSYTYQADPNNCTVYHRCDIGVNATGLRLVCPPDTVFCPSSSTCVTVDECLSMRGYVDPGGSDEELCPSCRCGDPIPPDHPSYACGSVANETDVSDASYCDIFHKCQDNGYGGFIDHPMRCPVGLIFCEKSGRCEVLNTPAECTCKPGMRMKQCEVCGMGKWSNFDIFKQQFTTP